MFTGIIESIGTVAKIHKEEGGARFSIRTTANLHLRIGDSIAVDGCCLTVVERIKNIFSVVAVEETLMKTKLSHVSVSDTVNLERPMSAEGRFGGHIVLGHVDCVGVVKDVEHRETSRMFYFTVPAQFMPLLVSAGSVAVNGVSLTVAQLKKKSFGVSIIPHTHRVTTFGALRPGNPVNIEFDVIGKYVQNLLHGK